MSTSLSPPGPHRILMIVPVFLPHVGGVERHVDGVARNLAERGHEVSILTVKHESGLPDHEVRSGVQIFRAPSRGRRSMWSWLLRHLSIVRNSDVVHCHDYDVFYRWYLPFRFLFPSIPVYVTFHGFEKYPPEPSAIRARHLVAGLSAGHLCVGEYISKWYGTPCPNVVIGATDAKAREGVRRRENAIVFLGRLEPDTSPGDILQGCRILKERYNRDVRIDVCGDGSLRTSLQEFSARHGLSATFHGFVPDARPFLTAAEFVVAAGYLSMLEAMASGATVLAYAPNPLRRDYWSIPGLGGRVPVVTGTPDEFAVSLRDLLQDSNRAAELAARGHEFATTQTWNALGDQYIRLYGVRS